MVLGKMSVSAFYPASRAFLSGKSLSMYKVVFVSGISHSLQNMLKDLPDRNEHSPCRVSAFLL